MAEYDSTISRTEIRVLDYILRLELTEARWDRVDGILANAVEAAAAGDVGTLRTTMSQLRAIGPVRTIRIGGILVGPPPVKIRERVDQIRIAIETAGDIGETAGDIEKADEKGSYDHHGPA